MGLARTIFAARVANLNWLEKAEPISATNAGLRDAYRELARQALLAAEAFSMEEDIFMKQKPEFQ